MKQYFLIQLVLILQFCLSMGQACSSEGQYTKQTSMREGEVAVYKREANFKYLMQQARRLGSVAVIIRFDLNGVLSGRLPAEILSTPLSLLSPAQEETLVKVINEAQNILLESLQGKGEISTVKKMKYSPSLAFTVDQKVLLVLRENPNVLDIHEDEWADIHPAEAFPSIQKHR